MNEYCKSCLKHSWGKSPERKRLEKVYNSNYYQENRSRILQRASERRTQQVSDYNDIVMAPFTLYSDSGEFVDYSKKAFTDMANVGTTAIATVKKSADSIKRGIEFVKSKLKEPIEKLKKTKIVKSIKSFFDKLKYYKSQATI